MRGNMRVLVGCEFSGVVRDAFREKGHDAWSCDFEKPEGTYQQYHYQYDVRDVINNPDRGWDLLIAHPPCTHLAVSGARHFKDKTEEQEKALMFVKFLLECKIPRICIENPISVISTQIRKPDQIIQPWMFGHPNVKSTCLWLVNLPQLTPTQSVVGRESEIMKLGGGDGKERSRTYPGIARAMAEQWSNIDQLYTDLEQLIDME